MLTDDSPASCNQILTNVYKTGQDMQFLADDELLLNRGENPTSIDTAYLYTGRLVSKFLLSFMDEDRIFGGKI